MNLLEIIVIGIVAVCIFIGYRTGFLQVVYSLFAWTLALALGTWASPYLVEFLEQNTGIKAAIQEFCVGYIENLAKEQTTEPAMAVFGELLEGTGIYEGIAAEAAGFVLKGIAFLVTMIAVGILLHLLWRILDLASHLPVIEGANKMLGAAAGALKGLLIVWALLGVIRLCGTIGVGGQLLGWVEESVWLKEVYEYNFLFRIIMKLLGGL